MSDQPDGAAVARGLQARLAAAVAADRALVATIADAHRIAAAARRRLEDIGARVQGLLTEGSELPLDAPLAVRRALTANLREMETVVAETAAAAAAKTAAFKQLSDAYRAAGPSSTG